MHTINFVIFSNAQGRSKEVMSEKQLMDKHPDAKNLREAVDAEATTWDIEPIIEIHQGYECMEDAADFLRALIYAVLHYYDAPNATDLYRNMDFDNIISTTIHSEYVGQTVYYYLDKFSRDSEIIEMVRDNQK